MVAPTFSKKERIVSSKLMETLFEKGDSQAVTAFKHAVDRNRVKRQVREAYRHHKETIYERIATDKQLLVAFIWLSDRHYVSAEVERRVSRILQKIAQQL